ncbi:hypothetical protein TRIP_D310125 [uncultured Paludibacter sp.]|uniref:Translocation and assembly module TamB C-terminal domain-containing protein n=1 Tax=uncultured Paludibacter sp. TaxID=497635 RepID=A0A653ACE3_9BACT|nr:hypothetical protein TRIP_D310125 [uncultured Paludibacter sp.]
MKVLKIILRILMWFIIGIFILMIAAGVALQTRAVKNKIAQVAQSQLNKILIADSKIGRIEGDFFTHIYVKDILLKEKNKSDTITFIPIIRLRYNLLSLLGGTIKINSVELEKPYFSLKQYSDSTWNIMKIVRPSEKKDTAPSSFNMIINAKSVKINDGTIIISSIIKQIPKRVNHFFTDISAIYSNKKQKLDLKNMHFVTKEPDFVLNKLTFSATRDTNSISIEKFRLKTALNEIKADIEYVPNFNSKSVLSIKTAPLHLEEIKCFFPDVELKLHPEITMNAQADTIVHFKLNVKDKVQKLEATFNAKNILQKYFKKNDVIVTYNLDGDFENIDLRDWLNNSQMKYILTGSLKAKGEGVEPKTLLANIEGDLNKSIVLNNRLDLATFDITLIKQRVTGYLNASGNFGKVNIKPVLDEIFEKNPKYNLNVYTQRLNLAKLMNNKQLNSNINFEGNVYGVGINPQTMRTTVKGNFTNTTVYQQTFNTLNVNIKLAEQNLTGQLNGFGNFGTIKIAPNVKKIFSNNPSYTLDLQTQCLNLAKVLNDTSFNSNINLVATFDGVGFDPEKMHVNANMKLDSSSAKGVNIDDLHTKFTFANNQVNIKELSVKTSTLDMFASGVYSMKGNSDLNVKAKIKDGTEISQLANLENFETQGGSVDAHVIGHPKELYADVVFDFDTTKYNNLYFENLKGNAATNLMAKKKTLDGNINVKNFKTGNYTFNSINLSAKSKNNATDLQLNADGTEIETKLTSSLELGDETNVGLSDFMLNYKNNEWKLASPQAYIKIGKNEYVVQDMKLISTDGDSIQVIYADGTISKSGNQDMKIQLQNIDLHKIMDMLNINYKINGNLYLDMTLKGTAINPLLTANYNIKNTTLSDYSFPYFDGSLNYNANKLGIKSDIVSQDSGKLKVDGTLPFEMRLDSMKFNVEKNKSLVAQLKVEKFPLEIVKLFQPIDEVKGSLDGDVLVEGTLENPNPTGEFRLTEGALKWKKYGIDYRTMLANINIQTDKIGVDTFYIRSKDGYMSAKGNAGFKSQFYLGNFKDSKINVKFRNFNPFDHRLFNAEMSGDLKLQGVRDSLVFDGNIKMLQSLFYIPAVMNLFGKTSAPEISKPVLVSELENMHIRPDSVIFTLPYDSVQAKDEISFNLFKSLQGKLKLNIPRNTWIKNEQLRIELMGDLDVYKYRDYFELFGTVDVVRGQYELLGKTFVVKSGSLAFEGGKEINPTLNIDASYTLRTQDKAQRDLRILATGTLQKPELDFTLDGETLSEGDAVSYILFGTSMDNLTSQQQLSTGSSITAQGVAGTAAASLISSQLTKLLGNTLSVDYIEFKTSGSFDQASFVVGKYITNKLFMSYERRFGNYKDDNLNEYEVRLEYELFKFLFLQLTSSPISNGIDAIVKLNSK